MLLLSEASPVDLVVGMLLVEHGGDRLECVFHVAFVHECHVYVWNVCLGEL
jgi:Ni2+-binding GTPase involved in maturation of urease and hydrogenase